MSTLRAPTDRSLHGPVRRRPLQLLSAVSGWLFFAALLMLWELAGRLDTTGLVTPFSIVVVRVAQILTGPQLVDDILPSLARTIIGFAVAGIVGIIAGLVLGWFRAIEPWFRGILEFMRAVPPPAYVPILILVLGADSSTRVLVIAIGSIWPVLLSTTDATRRTESGFIDSGRVYAGSTSAVLWRIVLPSALPAILAGLRISLAISLILMVVSEMISSTSGLGYLLLQSQRLYDLPTMYASVVILGILGFVLVFGFTRIERRVTVWYEGTKGRTND